MQGDPEHCDGSDEDGYCLRVRASNIRSSGDPDVAVHIHVDASTSLLEAMAQVGDAIQAQAEMATA